MSLVNFQSSREIEKQRQEIREARQSVLEKAKQKYERDERRKELARQKGEDSWILPSVEQRLEKEKKELKESKSKKKKKEKKKKKHKERKKKKKESSSDSSSEEEEGSMWVEKDLEIKTDDKPAIKGPRLERESWMEAPIDLVPTISRKDLISKREIEKEEQRKQKELLEKPGASEKEINPYWKDGGTGLPQEERSVVKPAVKVTGVGDSGLTWLRKSYQRCVEQAREEGRSLEDLAAERWGSLEKIQQMIREAEAVAGQGHRRQERSFERPDRRRDRFMRPGDQNNDYKRAKHRSRSRSRSPNRKSYSSNKYSHRSRSPSDRRSHRHSRSRSRERYRKSRSRSKSPNENSHKISLYRKSRSRSRERDRNRKRSRSRSKDRTRDSAVSNLGKSRFMKPGEMDENNDRQGHRSYSRSDKLPAWKKKEFQKPVDSDITEMEDNRKRREADRKKDVKEGRSDGEKRRKSLSPSSSSDSSSDSDSSEESDVDEGHGSRSQEPEASVKVLTEKEMNELGAKILRAELMGNQDLVEKLKTQMEAARRAAENQKASGAAPRAREQGRKPAEDDDFVMLTRTDRAGVSRPVPDQQHPREAKGGRRKKQKVETHTGKKGERTKYFDDDDKFDLKTMVEREKLGTAEDQNQMFARLAGRAAEKTNDDFQVDDVFLSKANRKQSESQQEERDRAQAIFEHRKMASALEKCNFCFGNVPKHLIVAIGTKSYLCLPNNKSLTEGHCLIVPMTHVSSGTACDEDVWNEIQVFRKTLTRMFSEREEDVVFMETCMRLKQFPHMSVECIPMDKEVGDLAPIYFKKALQECETEWSQNKKVVDISQKDIRHAVPKGFPYFSVDFGNQGGFAHVIEDEQSFPWHFGREIIGGMIDADHKLWRKPSKENFDEQRKKVMKFAEMWKPYDWTQHIAKNDSDSD